MAGWRFYNLRFTPYTRRKGSSRITVGRLLLGFTMPSARRLGKACLFDPRYVPSAGARVVCASTTQMATLLRTTLWASGYAIVATLSDTSNCRLAKWRVEESNHFKKSEGKTWKERQGNLLG